MLPSRAYVGRSVTQASVEGTAVRSAWKVSVGVMTDEPVPNVALAKPTWCSPARRGPRASRPARRGSGRRPAARVRRGPARTARSTAAQREGSRPAHRRGRTAQATSPGRARRRAGSGRRCPPHTRSGHRPSDARPARRRRCPDTHRTAGHRADGRAASAASAPENMASIRSPVRARTWSSASFVARVAHHDAVRRSCQPMTGPSGSPVLRRQATTDSRWLEMVTPARAASEADARQAATAASTLDQISSASCSIHPGRGDARPTGAAPYPATCPASSTRIALELVVP